MSCIPCGNMQMGKVIDLSAGVAILELRGSQYRAKLPANCHPQVGQEMVFYLCQGQAYAICPDRFKRTLPPTVEEQPVLAFPTIGQPVYIEVPGTHIDTYYYLPPNRPNTHYHSARSMVDPFYYYFVQMSELYREQGPTIAVKPAPSDGASGFSKPMGVSLPFTGSLPLYPMSLPYRDDYPVTATAVSLLLEFPEVDLREAFLKRYSSGSRLLDDAINRYVEMGEVANGSVPPPEDVVREERDYLVLRTEDGKYPLTGNEGTADPKFNPRGDSITPQNIVGLEIDEETEVYTATTEVVDVPICAITRDLKVKTYQNYKRDYPGIGFGLKNPDSGIPETSKGYIRSDVRPGVLHNKNLYVRDYRAELEQDVYSFTYDIDKYTEDVYTIYPVYVYSVVWQKEENSNLGYINVTVSDPIAGPPVARRQNYTSTTAVKNAAADNPDEYATTQSTYEALEMVLLTEFAPEVNPMEREYEDRQRSKQIMDIAVSDYLSALGGSGPVATEILPEDYGTVRIPADLRIEPSYLGPAPSYLVPDPRLPDRVGVAKMVLNYRSVRSTGSVRELRMYSVKPSLGTIFGHPGTCSLTFDGWIHNKAGTNKRYVKYWEGVVVPNGIDKDNTTTSHTRRGIYRYFDQVPGLEAYGDTKPSYRGQFGTIVHHDADTRPPENQPRYKLLDIEIPISEQLEHAEILLRFRDVAYAAVINLEISDEATGAREPYIRMQRKKVSFKPGEENSESAWYPRVLDYWEGRLSQLLQNYPGVAIGGPSASPIWDRVGKIEAPQEPLEYEGWPQASSYISLYEKNSNSLLAGVTFRPTLPADYPERHPQSGLVVDADGRILRDIPPLVASLVAYHSMASVFFGPMWFFRAFPAGSRWL